MVIPDCGRFYGGYVPFLCGTGGIDRYFYQDIMNKGKEVLVLELLEYMVGFRGVSWWVPRCYQERGLTGISRKV